ncbi:MAG: oligoendopeptidase F [Alkaliphilus sp.]|nr:M3 family oligoendopeptidase [bacterium AH-315-G05]PHS35593.1 MAG: oligoendopeptidase F [Alkaliphilus sp.]
MSLKWSLDELFTSFESNEFKDAYEKSERGSFELTKFSKENFNNTDNAKEKIEKCLKLTLEYMTPLDRIFAYCSLTFSVDTKNEKAVQVLGQMRKIDSAYTKPTILFEKWLCKIENLDEIIASSVFLTDNKFYLNEIINSAQYLLDDQTEMLISNLRNTGSNAWRTLQSKLSSSILVDIEIDGETKKLPLSTVRNMAYSPDKELRKRAYHAELESYKIYEEASAAALNSIKGEVLTLSELRGFDSPLAETLHKSKMDKETLDTMLSAMEDFLPVFHKYFKRKAKIFGHKNGLPFYDMFAPLPVGSSSYTYDETKEFITTNFREFSSELADYAQNAFDKNWIDVKPREGKRGGAFCYNLPMIKESRIMLNFDGSLKNVTTVAHELGHGYHGYNLKDENSFNTSYPMPLAETASTFCETIVQKAAIKSADDSAALSLLEGSIQGYGQIIVDIYARFLFESELFETRKDHELSVTELKDLIAKAQKAAYGDAVDHDFLHPYMWMNKPHYYSATRNFYNFPYSFGLLFAKGLYAEYLSRGESFIKEYDVLLNRTGKNNITDVAKMMNIDVNSKEFWVSSLKEIEKEIELFLELSKNL